MSFIIRIGRVVLQLIFDIHKLAPVRNKVTVISRQSNDPSLDIQMLTDRIRSVFPGCEVVVLCRKLDNKAGYLGHMLTSQMHHIATSRVVVLDSYCILISFLRQRRDLRVLQMWHALGAYKKFGKSILGQEEGSSAGLAEVMHMHRGYDRILTSSEASRKGFAEAFGYGEDAFEVIPLPRVDLLRDPEYLRAKREEILAKYPAIGGKEVILYAPTLRRGDGHSLEEQRARAADFLRKADTERYNVIYSPHPVISREVTLNGETPVPGFSTMELLAVADYFVTDYSATVYEAAVMGVRTYIYAYDIAEYVGRRGFYLDPYKDLPSDPRTEAADVLGDITGGAYDYDRLKRFADTNVVPCDDCTGAIVSLIDRLGHLGQ